MNSIEMQIGSQRFILKGEDDEPHLQEVAEMVRRKVEALRKKNPTLNLQRASMLASFDLASQLIKGRRKALEYRSEVVAQTTQLLDQVEETEPGLVHLKLEDRKAQARKAWRSQYPKDLQVRQQCSAEACQYVLSSPEFQQAKQVGIFAGLIWELDLLRLWGSRPDACVFPKVKGETMAFFQIEKKSDLVPGHAGILEPLRDIPARPWTAADLILVPGSAFDRQGGRVGSGKGFYDRFLASCPAQKWGIGYSAQIVEPALAQGPLDVRMGAIVTEQGIIRI